MIRPLRLRFVLAVLLALGCAWLLLSGCADATQIRLLVYTDVPCTSPSPWQGVAVYVGKADSNLENKAPALTTTTCDANGQVGSLVLVPSGSKEEEVLLRVVAGITRNPEECASHEYQGCIVARRSVRFNRHATLDLEIGLTADCRGVGCDAAHTCVDGTCSETRTLDTTPVVTPDAPPEAKVRCGDNGVYCPTTGNVCCLTVDQNAGTTSGECRDPATCVAPKIVLYCDDETDCSGLTDELGRVGMCYVSFTAAPDTQYNVASVAGTQCVHHANTYGVPHYGFEMCETREPCLGGTRVCVDTSGTPQNPLPGYHWCLYDVSNDPPPDAGTQN